MQGVHVHSNDQAPTLSRELLVVAAALECVGEPGFKLWALPPHAVLACPDRAYTWWQYVVSVLLYNFSCFYPTLVFVIHVCAVAQLSCYGSALLAPMCCIVFDVGAALYTCGTPSCAKRTGLTGACAKACCAHAMTGRADRALVASFSRATSNTNSFNYGDVTDARRSPLLHSACTRVFGRCLCTVTTRYSASSRDPCSCHVSRACCRVSAISISTFIFSWP